MSEPVKTTLLKALETMLQSVDGIATVQRDCQFPFDFGALPLPVLIFYEDYETPGVDNRLAKNNLDLDLVLFDVFSGPVMDENSLAWQSFKDKADAVAGAIHGLWHDQRALVHLRAAGLIRVEERGNRKAPCNADYGEMVLTVRLTYGHPLGQALIN